MLNKKGFKVFMLAWMLCIFASIVFGATTTSRPSASFKTSSGSTFKVTQSPPSNNSIMRSYQAQSVKQQVTKTPSSSTSSSTKVVDSRPLIPAVNTSSTQPERIRETRVIKETRVIDNRSSSPSLGEMFFWSSMFNRPQEKVVVVQQPGVVAVPQQTVIPANQSVIPSNSLPTPEMESKPLSLLEKWLVSFGAIMIIIAVGAVGYSKLKRREHV